MSDAVRRDHSIVVQFQHRAVKNECQGGHQLGPHPRQHDAGHDDDQGIEEVERTVPSSGFMDDQADQNQVGKKLQRGLQPVFLPQGKQEHEEQRQAVPEKNGGDEEPQRQSRRRELGDRQLNTQQQGQDKNSDSNQPH